MEVTGRDALASLQNVGVFLNVRIAAPQDTFFDPDYESREPTLLVSCRRNNAPGILPASLVLTSLVQLSAPVSNYLRPFTGYQSPS